LVGVFSVANKDFKTLDEQIAILESRGLKIPDKSAAKEFLLRNNYYRVSGYSLTLRDYDVFFESATFQNIIDIYECDQEMRHILLKYIEIIEVTVKSAYSYEFTKVHGPTGYLDNTHFSNAIKHTEIINKAEQQKITRLPHEAYLKHFVTELQEDVPLWAYVDLLTIADISFLFSISETAIKIAVANATAIAKRGDEVVEAFMHKLTIIRNLCAHGSRLFNRLFEQKPWLNKKELAILRVDEDGNVDNAHLFGFILIMRRLLKTEDSLELKNELIKLSSKHPFVKMKYYGFPDNWQNVL